MRVLGLRANDKAMTEAFFDGEDIHKATAALAFDTPLDNVTKDQRQAAKAVSFGICYGKSEKAQAVELGITEAEAHDIFQKYYATKPDVERFINDTHAFVEKYGYVETMQGHRRLLKDIWAKDKKNDALRKSVNTIIQGTGAYLTNTSVIYIDDFLQKNNMQSKLVATVHDSIVLDCHPDEAVTVVNVAKFIMENTPIPFLKIPWGDKIVQYPIGADAEVGYTYKGTVGFDEEDFKTFKSIKGYADYHKALAKFEDYADSKVITKEQMEEGQASIEASKAAYQAME